MITSVNQLSATYFILKGHHHFLLMPFFYWHMRYIRNFLNGRQAGI